ncbi:MAG: 23S rRNA (pseudouridine(1915)-N(3))-methyltransferase RlmH [Pseudomonadota bacterium]
MRLTIIAIGRIGRGPEAELCDRYRDRIRQTGRAVGITACDTREFREANHAALDPRRTEEATRIIGALPPGAKLVALDERGKSQTSQAFAGTLAAWRDAGTSDLAFAIGGPDGHDAALRTRADALLALGPMTMPHGLARAVLLEQLYRATTILAGHPYHRA